MGLKKETIKYCQQDCEILWFILQKFNNEIFNNYNLNINRYPTLPSLAFGIFKTQYMDEKSIPKIHGNIYDEIKTSYTGEHTDMYIPTSFNNELIYCYDVNSLYPYVM